MSTQSFLDKIKAKFDRNTKRLNSDDLPGPSSHSERVLVNVYDMLWLNEYTSSLGVGVYHTGVVIYGTEYCYGGHPLHYSGIFAMLPRDADSLGENYAFRTTLLIGYTDFSESDVALILEDMGPEYRGDQYHLLHRNCNHFTDAFVQILCGKPLPKWINRLATVGAKLPFVERSIPREWLTPRPYNPDDVTEECSDVPTVASAANDSKGTPVTGRPRSISPVLHQTSLPLRNLGGSAGVGMWRFQKRLMRWHSDRRSARSAAAVTPASRGPISLSSSSASLLCSSNTPMPIMFSASSSPRDQLPTVYTRSIEELEAVDGQLSGRSSAAGSLLVGDFHSFATEPVSEAAGKSTFSRTSRHRLAGFLNGFGGRRCYSSSAAAASSSINSTRSKLYMCNKDDKVIQRSSTESLHSVAGDDDLCPDVISSRSTQNCSHKLAPTTVIDEYEQENLQPTDIVNQVTPIPHSSCFNAGSLFTKLHYLCGFAQSPQWTTPSPASPVSRASPTSGFARPSRSQSS